ncbi:MAG: YigZ family protein [Clostridia bacterium]|nr:YigZ family protein [Clostridia bacterium]
MSEFLSYRTLAGPGRDEIVIQKSRFIGQAWPCVSEEEALSHLRRVREETRDARHHCYAYIIGKNEGILRYSDDGEPGGTAGMPIISLLRSEKLVDCCCVVTRYFGGILLGTGGLVRAYTEGCRVAIRSAGMVRMEKTCRDLCEVPYSCWDTVRYTLDRLPARCEDLSYGAAVSFTLLTRSRDRDSVLRELEQVSGRTLVALEDGEKYAAWED